MDQMEESTPKSKEDKIYDTLKDLEGGDVADRKRTTLKELDKLLKQFSQFDVAKSSERNKLHKLMEKITDQLLAVTVIDRVLKEKDY